MVGRDSWASESLDGVWVTLVLLFWRSPGWGQGTRSLRADVIHNSPEMYFVRPKVPVAPWQPIHFQKCPCKCLAWGHL